MRAQFTFYRSFWDALKDLPAKDRTALLSAICEYALDEKEPSLTGIQRSIFTLIKPTLDTSARKADSGRLGGSKREANAKQSASKEEAKQKQNAREKEVEREGEDEGEKEVENECSIPPVPPFDDRPVLRDALDRWLAYKRERRETYKATGMTTLINQITRNAATYGDAAVAEVIDNSIASHYQGIVFDRLKRESRSARIQTTAQPLAQLTPEQRRAQLERMGRVMNAMGGGEA